MHHQRSPWAASTTASIGQPSAGRNGRSASATSTTAADQQPGVQHHHHRVVAARRTPRPPRASAPGGVAPRDDQLGEPLDADREHQRRRTTAAMTRSRSPAQQDELGAEARAHRQQQPGRARLRAPRLPGCRAARAAPTPTTGCRSRPATARSPRARPAGRPSTASHRLEHLGAAGVADPAGDVLDRRGRGRPRKPADVVAEVLRDQAGHLGAEHDLQAAAADVPAHRPLGAGVEVAAGVQHLGPARCGPPAASRSAPTSDHRGGAVAEQPAGDQVGDRAVVAAAG